MPKIVPCAPKERSLARDLDAVIQGHQARLARFQTNRETPGDSLMDFGNLMVSWPFGEPLVSDFL